MSIISDDNFGKNHKRVDINAHKNPVIKAESIECDKNFENSIRPKSFDTYIGDHDKLVAWNIYIDVFQVVNPRSFD